MPQPSEEELRLIDELALMPVFFEELQGADEPPLLVTNTEYKTKQDRLRRLQELRKMGTQDRVASEKENQSLQEAGELNESVVAVGVQI